MAEGFKSLAEMGFNPMAAMQMGVTLQNQQEMNDIRRESLDVNRQNAETAAARVDQEAKQKLITDRAKLLENPDNLSDGDFFDAMDQQLKATVGHGLDIKDSHNAIVQGKELMRMVGEFRQGNPDAPLPPELQHAKDGYLQQFGANRTRAIRSVVAGEGRVTLANALKGNKDAQAAVAYGDKDLIKTVLNKDLESPLDTAKIEHIKKQGEEIDSRIGKIDAEAGVLLEQHKVLGAKVREYEEFKAPLERIQLEREKKKGETFDLQLEVEKLKNTQLKNFYDTLPQRQEEAKGRFKTLQAERDQIDNSLLGLRFNRTPDGVKMREQLESRMSMLDGQLESTDREVKYLENPTPETQKIFEQSHKEVTERLNTLAKTADGLSSDKTRLVQERLNLAKNKDQRDTEKFNFDMKQAKGLIQGANAAAELAATRGVKPHQLAVQDLNQIVKETGISYADLKKVLNEAQKDPNKPSIELHLNEGGVKTTEEAGKFSMIDNAIKDVDSIMGMITKDDGKIDRGLVFASSFNVPFTKGRDINSMIEDAVSAKLRAETGAAANKDEVISMAKRFKPNNLDSDDTIEGKMSRLRRFLSETKVLRDPTGKLQEIAGKAAQKKAESSGPITTAEDWLKAKGHK